MAPQSGSKSRQQRRPHLRAARSPSCLADSDPQTPPRPLRRRSRTRGSTPSSRRSRRTGRHPRRVVRREEVRATRSCPIPNRLGEAAGEGLRDRRSPVPQMPIFDAPHRRGPSTTGPRLDRTGTNPAHALDRTTGPPEPPTRPAARCVIPNGPRTHSSTRRRVHGYVRSEPFNSPPATAKTPPTEPARHAIGRDPCRPRACRSPRVPEAAAELRLDVL